MRLALLSCLFLIVVVAAWVSFGLGVEPPAPTVSPPGAGSSSRQSVGPVPVVKRGKGAHTASAVGQQSDRAVVEAATEPRALAVPVDATWIEVLVVDAKTGMPVPYAEVWWSNHVQEEHVRTLTPEQRVSFEQSDGVRCQLEQFGWRARCDESGMVRVSPGKEFAMVMAREGKRSGMGGFSDARGDSSEKHRLEIEEAVNLRVLVLDAAGNPANDVLVGVFQHSDAENHDMHSSFGIGMQTDLNGLASTDRVDMLRRGMSHQRSGKSVEQLKVAIQIPETESSVAFVDAQELPDEPIELELGATGQLRVRLLHDGRPLPTPRTVSLKSQRTDDESFLVYGGATRGRSVDVNGWVSWPHVPIGKTYRLTGGGFASLWGDGWEVEIEGPVVAMRTRVHEIELTQCVNVIVGRLVDESGGAIARERVSVDATMSFTGRDGAEGEDYCHGTLWTAEDGGFVWLLDRDEEHDHVRIREGHVSYSAVDGAQWMASLPECEVQGGTADVGDVRVTPGDVIVAGRIVYDKPGDYMPDVFIESCTEAGRWDRIYEVSEVVTDDYKFEVRGIVDAGRYRVALDSSRVLPVEPQEFALGTKDLQIKVSCGHSLGVPVVLPEGLESYRLHFVLIPEPGQPEKVRRSSAKARGTKDDKHEVRWEGLETGVYLLEVRSEAVQEPLFSLGSLGIPLPTDDHRLDEMDLREHVRSLTLDVAVKTQYVTPVAFVLPQHGDVWRGHYLRAGQQTVPVGPGAISLLVAARNHVPVTLHNVEGAVQVRLEPRPVAQLQFVHGAKFPAGFGLRVAAESLTPAAADARKYKWIVESSMGGLLQHEKNFQAVEGDRHDLALADGVNRLFVVLHSAEGERVLRHVSPAQLSGGGHYQISLSDEELAQSIAELRKN